MEVTLAIDIGLDRAGLVSAFQRLNLPDFGPEIGPTTLLPPLSDRFGTRKQFRERARGIFS